MSKLKRSVFVAWQNPNSRSWHVIGKLTKKENFEFAYTKGAKSNKFVPFTGMTDLHSKYSSKELFPLFSNRLLSKRRPEYSHFISWLGLSEEEASPMVVLAKSGGGRATDNLEIFPELELDSEGKFELEFFVHGIRYMTESAKNRICSLNVGERLYLVNDCQNEYDEYALAVRANEPLEIVGYCPRYLSKDLSRLLAKDKQCIKITVVKTNLDAPSRYQLLCRISASCDVGDVLLENEEYSVLAVDIGEGEHSSEEQESNRSVLEIDSVA